MSDQTLGPGRARTRWVDLALPARDVLSAQAAEIVTVLVATVVGVRLLWSEGGATTVTFAVCVLATIGTALVLATRRLLIAAVVVGALTLIISLTASIKLGIMNMVLHAYDLFFYLTDGAILAYLWSDHRVYLLSALLSVTAMLLAAFVAYRIDATRIPRRTAARMLVVLVAATVGSAWATGVRRHSQFEYEGQYISSFFLSFAETFETLRRGQIIEAAPASAGPSISLPASCEPNGRAPHIILIHHESIVQPSLFPTLAYDKALDPFFLSDDKQLRKLKVETYGGASTLTEFSVLTGLSTYAFGGMRQFVQTMMAGKIKDTLPDALHRCGYRSMVFYPMLRTFTMAEKFFSGVGLKTMFDAKDQKARVHNERDRFYYDNAMAEIARHVGGPGKGPRQQVFAFIETMATHWPYHETYQPEVDVAGGGAGTHPEMHEYLRRVAMAKMDYDYLVSELGSRFPGEPFLLVRYGDHHPMSTRTLLGFKPETEAEDVVMDRDSIAFHTFFAINGVNFAPALPPSYPTLDVPYLGVVLQTAAGLPMSQSWGERRRLMESCDGRYAGCGDGTGILSFHRRLIDSGLVDAR